MNEDTGRMQTRSSRVPAWFWWLGVLIWAVVLFTLSSRSSLPPGPEIPYQDKVMHFFYFGSGALCFVLALFGRHRPMGSPWKWAGMGALFGMIVGALDEYHQTFTPGRSGNDPYDWLADCLGAGTGALAAWVLLRLVRRWLAGKAR